MAVKLLASQVVKLLNKHSPWLPTHVREAQCFGRSRLMATLGFKRAVKR